MLLDDGLRLVADALVTSVRSRDLHPLGLAYRGQLGRRNSPESRGLHGLVAKGSHLGEGLANIVGGFGIIAHGEQLRANR